jgi:hypothetical protein
MEPACFNIFQVEYRFNTDTRYVWTVDHSSVVELHSISRDDCRPLWVARCMLIL